ncbi:degenerin unc-8 [Trichonephila inaurata madagascariensis]|uniref:Degenerin unc-8 n=1 Tax=Trichonephila inaurata madagascariensis TaxID=2747483 RepID=A0A8X6I9C1_9ARAC|nr:degenerin unc-8 [Trichonephila inaurata madagascariensis]
MGSMEFPAVTICSPVTISKTRANITNIHHLLKLQNFLESTTKLKYPIEEKNACHRNPACEWSWFDNRCKCLSNQCDAEFCDSGDPMCFCSDLMCTYYPKLCFGFRNESVPDEDQSCFCRNSSNMNNHYKFTKQDSGLDEIPTKQIANADVSNLLGLIRKAEVGDLADIEWAFQPDIMSIANYGTSFDSLVISCSFHRKRCDQRNFTVVYTPTHGKCYTFNHAGKMTKGQDKKALKTKRYGWNSGLQLYMEVNPHQMIDLLNKDIGVRVVVHDPLQLPYVSEYGLNIRPGDSTAIQVEKYQVNRLGYPWGKCLKSGKHLPFNYSYEPYSQLGCRRYCQNFYIKQHCNCVKRSLLSPSFNRPSKRKLNLICNFSDPIQNRECPGWWMWMEKVGGTKLAGFSGIKNQSPKFVQAGEKLVCYWSSGIGE